MIKHSQLMGRWYPSNKNECESEIKSLIEGTETIKIDRPVGGIVPHAGWYFSGQLAARVLNVFENKDEIDTVILFGGHTTQHNKTIIFDYDGFDTPLGELHCDKELLSKIKSELGSFKTEGQSNIDNTTEVQFPLIKYFMRNTKIIVLRPPLSEEAVTVGTLIGELVKDENKRIISIGSTDLTHYGPNYRFSPKGIGKDAVEWVKEKNDAEIISLFKDFKPIDAIKHAIANSSACSAGGAAASLQLSTEIGATKSTVIDYYTSYDIQPADSFVGYLGMVFSK